MSNANEISALLSIPEPHRTTAFELAKAVQQAERERCAKICDDHAENPITNKSRKAAAKFLASMIREG